MYNINISHNVGKLIMIGRCGRDMSRSSKKSLMSMKWQSPLDMLCPSANYHPHRNHRFRWHHVAARLLGSENEMDDMEQEPHGFFSNPHRREKNGFPFCSLKKPKKKNKEMMVSRAWLLEFGVWSWLMTHFTEAASACEVLDQPLKQSTRPKTNIL